MSEIKVFSGQQGLAFATELTNRLGIVLSPSKLSRFANDCLEVQLLDNCRERDVYLVQPLVTPTQESLMELLLMIDAARGASASRVTAVIPHYSYARSDKKDAPRISIGGRLVADLLKTAGVDRILTMELHSPQVHAFFRVPTDQLNALGEIAKHFEGIDVNATTVVSPDLGNVKSATEFAKLLGLPVAAGAKERFENNKVQITNIIGDVSGKDVIVLDDEIANGSTTLAIVDKLVEKGVQNIYVACTHGIFSNGALERISSNPYVKEIVTTDTVPQISTSEKLTVLSVAPAFAEAMRRIHSGESVSSMFISNNK